MRHAFSSNRIAFHNRVRAVSGLVDLWCPGEEERFRDLERRNRELNERRIAMGRMTREQADAQEARFNADDPSTWDSEIAQEFIAGAGEGLQCLPDTFRNAVNAAAASATGWTLRFIPWWVWVGVTAWGLSYLGVFDGISLKGSLSKKRK